MSINGLRNVLVQADRGAPIQVRADKNITVQACVDVLDLLAAERFNKVSLQTERSVKRE